MIKTLLAVAMCCALAGLTGCGSSSNSSSSKAAAQASATSGTDQTTGIATTSTTTTAATSGASNAKHSGAGHKSGSESDGGAAAGSGSSGGSAPSSGSGSGGSANSGGGSSSTSGSASAGAYGSLAKFGHPATGADETAVLTAFHNYLAAIGNGDWPVACTLLSAPVKKQLAQLLAHAHGIAGHGCTAALGALLGHAPAALRRRQEPTSVAAVRIDGDHAFVLYRSPQYPHATLSMTRESGRWTAGVLAAAGAP